ncbi:MAG: glycosyltransferase [Saprospiraceae bacterium]|nr:glycosyltransferase [Saprospiraceae bacterium]
MAAERALIIFVRNPELGKVKTRLAQTLGDQRALDIYLALLQHTREIAERIDTDRLVFYSHFIDMEDDWSNTAFEKFLQISGDLGDKIHSGFEKAFEKHSKVLIIGSDCASLTEAIVEEGFKALETHDFVLGPALDGGYYLLGMNQFSPSLFEDIPWSTDQVAALSLDKMKALGGSCHLLPTLSDIDYAEDWEKYGWEI